MKIEIKNSSWISLVIVFTLLVGTGYLLAQLYVQNYFPKSGYAVSSGSSENPMNVFKGRITDSNVRVGRFDGVTTYDANCIGQEITECDAGIRTSEFGVLNFHYSHNMAIQPCLHMFGTEKVIVEILDSSGSAKITRTIDVSGMGHHG